MTRHSHVSDAALADLAPHDERGPADSELVRCGCGDVVPKGDSVHGDVCAEWDDDH